MFFRNIPVWGHRGWPSRYPDNVRAGIVAAAEVAAGVEIDVRRAADGTLVLSHDADVGGLVVADHTWEEIARLRLGGHRPARLDDVIDLGVPLDIEIKNLPGQPGFEEDHRVALDAAERARTGDIVTCFYWPSMAAVRRSMPSVRTGLLFDAPVPWRDALDAAVDGGHEAIAPRHDLIVPDLAAAAATAGIEVMAWTVDDLEEALRLADLGVAAIISNRPGELIAESRTSEQSP